LSRRNEGRGDASTLLDFVGPDQFTCGGTVGRYRSRLRDTGNLAHRKGGPKKFSSRTSPPIRRA